jgi:hypothetical protein
MTVGELYQQLANGLVRAPSDDEFLNKEIYISDGFSTPRPLTAVHVLTDTGNLLLAHIPEEQDPDPEFDSLEPF